MIAIRPQPHEESTTVVGPIRLVCQSYVDADDPDAYRHVGEVVREALSRVAAGRGPASGIVVQAYAVELLEQGS